MGGHITVADVALMCAIATAYILSIGTRTRSSNTVNFQCPLDALPPGAGVHALQNAHSPHSADDAKKCMSPACIVLPPSKEYIAQSPRKKFIAPDRAEAHVCTPRPDQPKCETNVRIMW